MGNLSCNRPAQTVVWFWHKNDIKWEIKYSWNNAENMIKWQILRIGKFAESKRAFGLGVVKGELFHEKNLVFSGFSCIFWHKCVW